MTPSVDGVKEVAHDFNNLLTAIIGAAESVLERAGLDPETRADLESIREGARRGTAMARLLCGQGGGAGLVAVNEAILAVSRLLAHGSSGLEHEMRGSGATALPGGTLLTLELDDPGPYIWADPPLLDRVLLNLVTNARHATRDGGTVTLHTSRHTVTTAEQHIPDLILPGDYAVITVADTGTGIPAEQLPHIFSRGFTTRRDAGGTGLGLATVFEIVHRSGGFLAVDSKVGEGTRIEIHWPRRPAPGELSVPRSGFALLVEDDPLVSRVAERMLRRAGWRLAVADSAEAAIALLEAEEASYDLLISDVELPGMDGVALAKYVRSRRPALPIVMTSGYPETRTTADWADDGIAFLSKPYRQNELLAVMARVVTDRGE